MHISYYSIHTNTEFFEGGGAFNGKSKTESRQSFKQRRTITNNGEKYN